MGVYKLDIYQEVQGNDGSVTFEEPFTLEQGNTNDTYGLLVDVSFHKEIYQPGCIEFKIQYEIQVQEDQSVINKTVDTAVHKGLVTLKYDNNIVAQNYYIFERKKTKTYLYCKAYSIDKFLTIDKFNRAHTGKYLVDTVYAKDEKGQIIGQTKGIVQSVLNDVDAPAIKKYKELTPTKYVKNLNHLCYKDSNEVFEPLLPYSVQYDESFYDFLVRMCNRYGEFLYFEDGNLHIGLESKNLKDEPCSPDEEECYESCVDFGDELSSDIPNYLTDNYLISDSDVVKTLSEDDGIAGDQGYASLEDSEDYEKRMLQTTITEDEMKVKTMTSFGEVRNSRGIGAEEFFEPIRNEQYAHLSDFTPPLSTAFDGIKSFAEHRTLYNAIASTAIKESLRFGISAKFRDDMNNKFDKLYEVGKYEFSDSNSKELLVTGKYYTEICKREEEAEKGKRILKYSTYQDLLLGDRIDIGGKIWVVYSVKGGSKYEKVVIIVKDDKGKEKEEERLMVKEDLMEVLLVPIQGNSCYPLPLWEKHIRKASPQRAFVVFNFDPDRLGRVRVKYPWQYMGVYTGKYGDKSAATMKGVSKREDATPWIRVAYPMASNGSGFMFFPAENDEVLIDYEDGNIERPFVAGSFYNINNQPAIPADMHMAGVTKSITSANGHHIKFQDVTGYKFLSELLPFVPILAKFGLLSSLEGDTATKWKNWGSHLRKYLAGGFEIGDHLGVYSIKGTTHTRNITISSPVGDIVLDAFTGITIKAPHGDVNIVGKNVNIEARNNLTMTSGTNINHTYFGKGNNAKEIFKGIFWDFAGMLPVLEGGLMKTLGLDFSHIRTILEVFLRPIGGTMLIKSYRFMCVEAGKGDTSFRKTPDGDKEYQGLKSELEGLKMQKENIATLFAEFENNRKRIKDLMIFFQQMSLTEEELAVMGDICRLEISKEEDICFYKYGLEPMEIILWQNKFNVVDSSNKSILSLKSKCKNKTFKRLVERLEVDFFDMLDKAAKMTLEKRVFEVDLIEELSKADRNKILFEEVVEFIEKGKYLKRYIKVDESIIEHWDNPTIVEKNNSIQLKVEDSFILKKKIFGAPLKTLGFMGFLDENPWKKLEDGGIIYSVDKKKAYIMKDQGIVGFNGTPEAYTTKLNVVGAAIMGIKDIFK